MIILGDKVVPYEDIEKILKVEDIAKTKPNATLFFSYDEDLMQFCFKNSLNYAVLVSNIKQGIYSNALNAKYIVCNNSSLSKSLQKIAQNYMFDSKILQVIASNNEIEDVAKDEIDGVIYINLL